MSNFIGRRHSIPILYTKGTYYDVGFEVGRTFKGLINDYLSISDLMKEYLTLYDTEKGRKLYDESFSCVSKYFPQYIRELEGIANGADVPFFKLFLLNLSEMVPTIAGNEEISNNKTFGCSSIYLNESDQEILGHTEDAPAECLGMFYIVSAHIIEDEPQGRWKVKEEKFTTLCYPGCLPGFTMNYNHHGLVYSINVIHAKNLYSNKTPGTFLCRALLAARNYEEAIEILKDEGCGSAEGFSVNMTFLNSKEEKRVFHNVEIGAVENLKESSLNVIDVVKGQYSFHCNKYLRLNLPEKGGLIVKSSDCRHKIFDQQPRPKTKEEVIKLLSHQDKNNFTFFRDYDYNDVNVLEPIATLAVGIFDLVGKTWSIYADNPNKCDAIVVLPLVFKD